MPKVVEEAMALEPMGNKFAQNGRVDRTGEII